MPTYEYLCPKGHAFEVFQRITADPGANCPECGEKAERQLSSGAGFLFKGSGFYITDYRSDSYKKAASQEKPSAGADSKPAGGADAKSGDAGKSTPGSSSGAAASGSSPGGSSPAGSSKSGSGGSSGSGSGGSSSKTGE